MLVPGDNSPYHSRVVFWSFDGPSGLLGKEWGWLTGNDGCVAFPSASFNDLGLGPSGVDIFCSGHAPLGDATGRILLAGGTDPVINIYGERRARIYTPSTHYTAGSWSTGDTMKFGRWYPSLTALRTPGRALVMGGQSYRHHRFFGGRHDGAVPSGTVGDSVYRFAPVKDGWWDAAVYPSLELGNKPGWREGHTFVEMGGAPSFKDPSGRNYQVLFGGSGASGTPLNDTWFLTKDNNPLGSDYAYAWTKKPPNALDQTPPVRSDHTAIPALNNMMVVYGGRDNSGAPLSDVFRLYKSGNNFQWSQIIPTGTAPTARFGHTAIYDETIRAPGDTLRRMIVYGGTSALNQAPTDTSVYELRFNSPTSATWSKMTQVGGGSPAPRYWHSMTQDPNARLFATGDLAHVAFLFGGALGGGAYSDTLWALWIHQDGTVSWERKNFGGDAPLGRARHSATFDAVQGKGTAGGEIGRLYISGGETTSGPADPHVFVVDPWNASPTPTWSKWADPGYTLSGASEVLERDIGFNRIPEVYDAVTGHWTAYTNAPLNGFGYPVSFIVPGSTTGGGRVVTVAPDWQSYWLDLPASGLPATGWQTASGLSSQFAPESGVMYLGSWIMIAGGLGAGGVVGTTKNLNVSGLNASSAWHSAGVMQPRIYTNLVLLPTGKVLAVGGNGTQSQSNDAPITRPQIWDPATETWSALTDLADQPTVRGYHSTAILLPDGRVLSAGGSGTSPTTFDFAQTKANLFCPPYLFKADGVTPATRPVITAAPTVVPWGKAFTICTPNFGQVSRVCLIRSGATTHGFDQNQRYLPLSFNAVPGSSTIRAFAPASADSSPPGYYLLFLTGSADGVDVPSIASWVRLGDDPVTPCTITDLGGCPHWAYPHGSSGDLWWTAPTHSTTYCCSPPAGAKCTAYDIRRSTAPITEGNWISATLISGVPSTMPGAPGTAEYWANISFGPGKWYIRMKASNAGGGWSALSNETIIDLTGFRGLRGWLLRRLGRWRRWLECAAER